jgi:hypothetical protein
MQLKNLVSVWLGQFLPNDLGYRHIAIGDHLAHRPTGDPKRACDGTRAVSLLT